MAWKLVNFGRMSLIQSAALADTTIYVSSADGDLLGTFGVGDQVPAVLFNADYREIIYITAESAGALTVSRGQESTSARDWAAGTVLVATPTAQALQAVLNAAVSQAFAGTLTNTGNAYSLNVGSGNSVPTLVDGERCTFEINATNTGAITLVVTNGVDSTASKSVIHQDGQALEAGDWASGWHAEVVFDATDDAWNVVNIISHQAHAQQLNDGPLPAVNRHPNGRFDYWNAATSFTTPASLAETADGVYVQYDGTIGAFTVSRQAFTLGQSDVPGDPKYFLRWD